MTKTTVYSVNGTEVNTLKEVAKLLGVSKKEVTVDAILEGKFPEVTLVADTEATADDVIEDAINLEEEINREDGTGNGDEDANEDSNTTAGDLAPEGGYPETGSFKTKKELQKYIKKNLSNEQLEDWCQLEGVIDTVKPCDHEGIWRMRLAMAICELHYPTEKKGTSSKSKYADLTTEQLVEMAREAGVTVKDSKGNDRIQRMYTIMALREEGYIQ